MKWLLVFASLAACVSARPSQRLSRDAEAPQLPRQNMTRLVSCDDVNRTQADSARSVESRSSQSRSRQTANRGSKPAPGDAWTLTSREAPSASSVALNTTSEDGAAFPGSSVREPYPAAADVAVYSRYCPLATCSVADLGSKLQAGEETAGASVRDSSGFGKK